MAVQSKRLDQEPWEPGGQEEEEAADGEPAPAYLGRATELITQALRNEKAGAYAAALQGYRDGVHILLEGVSGEQGSEEEGEVTVRAVEMTPWATCLPSMRCEQAQELRMPRTHTKWRAPAHSGNQEFLWRDGRQI